MRKWAFVILILGMFVLLLLMNFLPAKNVGSYEELEKLEINTKVILSGKVVEERVLYEGTKSFELDIEDSVNSLALVSNETSRNGIELICECTDSFLDEKIIIEGVVSEYEGKRQVEVLKIMRV